MEEYISAFDLLLAIAGVYMIYWGITGKGTVYRTETIKGKYAGVYVKTVKWFCLIGGVFAVSAGLLEYFHVNFPATILLYILCLIVFADFLVTFLWTDKEKYREHRLR
jgi:hypothetical protein